MSINLSKQDVVVGIAASGRTPYVIGGIEYAKNVGASCGCITTSKESILAKMVDFPVEGITGAEAITGSTRMKSGTAQKLVFVLNICLKYGISNDRSIRQNPSFMIFLIKCRTIRKYRSITPRLLTVFAILMHIFAILK